VGWKADVGEIATSALKDFKELKVWRKAQETTLHEVPADA
jgi:hypothetical protein